MTTPLTFQVDVSRTYRNKEGYTAGGYRLNTSFKTETHTPESFVDSVILPGWPYTMVHLKRSPKVTGAAARNVKTAKHTENFVSRQELTGDDDSARPGVIDYWLHDSFFSQHGFAFVESVNSKPGEAEKGHPTLIFDRPITDPALYKECAKALTWKYPQLDRGIHNVDRTIYNAEKARIHALGNICPFDVFEAEVLSPYRKHLEEQAKLEAEYQANRQAELERARAEGRVRHDADSLERYLTRTIDGIFNFVASQAHTRHKAIYWAGQKVGELTSPRCDWTKPLAHLLSDSALEERIIGSARLNGYLETYAKGNEGEVLRTFADGRRLGINNPAEEPELYDRQAVPSQPAQPGPKEAALLDEIGQEAKEDIQDHEARLRELDALGGQLIKAFDELHAENNGRAMPAYFAENADAVFTMDDYPGVDDDYYRRVIVPERRGFRGARAWRDHVTVYYPDLDPAEEYKRKRAEDKHRASRHCGMPIHYRGIDGKWRVKHLNCGHCESCKKRIKENLRAALVEVANQDPALCLTQITVKGKKAQARKVRELKHDDKKYKCFPIGGEQYHFLIAGMHPEQGELLDIIDLTDSRLSAWIDTPEGQRASGDLIGNFREILNGQSDDELEIARRAVYVELEKSGQRKRVTLDQAEYYKNLGYVEIGKRIDRSKVERLADLPEDPQAVGFELFGIVTDDKFPPEAAAVEEEVTNAEGLQKALTDTHKLIVADLRKRKGENVILCIVDFKKFYALNDIPTLCQRFNAQNQAQIERLKAKNEATK